MDRPWDDPFRLLLFLLITVTLSKVGGYFGFLRAIRPALLLFGLCVGYAFLVPRKISMGNLAQAGTVRLMAAIAVVACCSAVFGISLGHAALFFLNSFSKTLIICLLIIVSIRGVTDLYRLFWAFTLSGILLAYLSIFVSGISKTTSGATYDANDVGVFMVTMLPLALLLFQTSKGRLPRIVALVGIALLGATIVKTQSRGAFIGALAVGAALLLFTPGISLIRRALFVVVASVTMILSAPPGYWQSMQSILEDPKADYNWDAINGRRNLAKRGIGYMMSYPLFGVGIDNFKIAEGTISDKARNAAPGTGVRWASPHNSFVQAGAEAGVLGLALWLTLLLSNVVVPTRLRRRLPKTWRRGTPEERFIWNATVYVPVAQLGFAVTAFFVSFAWMEPLYFLSALVAGLVLVTKRVLAQGEDTGAPAAPRGAGFRTARARLLPAAQLRAPNIDRP